MQENSKLHDCDLVNLMHATFCHEDGFHLLRGDSVMSRRGLAILIVSACLLMSVAVRAQMPEKMFRIGLLLPVAEGSRGQRAEVLREGLREGLRDLGWVEGKNIIIETRWAGPNPERQRGMAAGLKALPVALIVAPGTITVRAALDGAPGVPVVMLAAGDPVGAGLVSSLARPAGNVTGTSAAGEEVLGKQLELLFAAVPHVKRVDVLMNTANPANDFFFAVLASRARTLGLQLNRINVRVEGELDAAVGGAKGGALVVVGDPMFFANRERITASAIRYQVASIYGSSDYVTAGGLMSYLSPDLWHWRSAARFVDKILRGATPGEIPVEQPTKFDLVINLKTARALGITISPSLLQRADELIK